MVPEYKPLPKFPAVTRDTVISWMTVTCEEDRKGHSPRAGRIFEDVKLFDIYKNKQVIEGKKSVAYLPRF